MHNIYNLVSSLIPDLIGSKSNANLSGGGLLYVTRLRSGEDPELWNTLKNASYRGGRAAKCFKYSPTEGDGGVWAIRSSPG